MLHEGNDGTRRRTENTMHHIRCTANGLAKHSLLLTQEQPDGLFHVLNADGEKTAAGNAKGMKKTGGKAGWKVLIREM